MRKIQNLVVVAVSLLYTITSARADWAAVDDFESGFDALPNASVTGENNWTAESNVGLMRSPADPGGRVLSVNAGSSDGNYRSLTTISDGVTGTLFLRFRINGGVPDVNVGASDSATPTGTGHQQVYVRINDTDLQYNNGSWVTLTGGSLAADRWYALWFVVNSPGDNEFEVYLDDGTGQVQLSDSGDTSLDFRNGPAGDLVSFFVHRNINQGQTGDQVVIDDLYIDAAAENLSLPVAVETSLTGFVEVDAFELFDTGSGAAALDENYEWLLDGSSAEVDEDTVDAGNNLLHIASSANRESHIPVGRLSNSGSGTLFWMFRLQNTTDADLSFGLTSADHQGIANAASVAGLLGPLVRILDDEIQVHDGGFETTQASTLAADVDYRLWMVVDNAANSWEAYIQGGAFTSQTKLTHTGGSDDTFAFRGSIGGSADDPDDDLVRCVLLPNSNNGSASVLVDNLYVDSGAENLLDPTRAASGGTVIFIR